MELLHKRIAFLGDSITEGWGVSSPERVYWNVLAHETGAECFGYGIGGTRIAPQRVPSFEPVWDRYFASRIEDMDANMDVVVVFGGTNDFGHGDAAFGHVTDRHTSTFCGAFHDLLQRLILKYPGSEIVVMTPLHRDGEDITDSHEFGYPRQAPLRTYVDAIVEISAYYGIPVLDLYRRAGMQPAMPMQKVLYMPDGLHPNDAGHERIARRLIGFLRAL